jgi:hypothetical protein
VGKDDSAGDGRNPEPCTYSLLLSYSPAEKFLFSEAFQLLYEKGSTNGSPGNNQRPIAAPRETTKHYIPPKKLTYNTTYKVVFLSYTSLSLLQLHL